VIKTTCFGQCWPKHVVFIIFE